MSDHDFKLQEHRFLSIAASGPDRSLQGPASVRSGGAVGLPRLLRRGPSVKIAPGRAFLASLGRLSRCIPLLAQPRLSTFTTSDDTYTFTLSSIARQLSPAVLAKCLDIRRLRDALHSPGSGSSCAAQFPSLRPQPNHPISERTTYDQYATHNAHSTERETLP